MILSPPEQLILGVMVPALLGILLLYWLLVRSRSRRIASLEGQLGELRDSRLRWKREVHDKNERLARDAESIQALRRTVLYIPEIAQRLAGNLDVRAIPDAALDLVEEIFEPTFAAFYRASGRELVAIKVRGECEYGLGHRLEFGAGVVGWTAERQMTLTQEDTELESALVRSQNLSKCHPSQGFSVCMPLVSSLRTLGVILVGPLRREQPHLRELARTLAMITAVSITSAAILRQQQMRAAMDGLTGLLNKTNILERAKAFFETPGMRNKGVSLFLMDIDDFKQFNDKNGHLRGDDLLKEISGLLGDHVRENEYVGRFGGEEFLLVMPATPKRQALLAAERFRALVAGRPFPGGERQPNGRVTISGGVATWPIDGPDLETVLDRADEALYAAKRAGRNRVMSYLPPDLALGSAVDGAGALDGDALTEPDKPDPPEIEWPET